MSIPSPCIGICQLDKAKICQGCHRSIDEIALWSSMSDAQRQLTLDRIEQRRQSFSSCTTVNEVQLDSEVKIVDSNFIG